MSMPTRLALSAQVVEVVAEQCRTHKVATLVVDPVLVSTSGHSLGDSEVASALKDRSAGVAIYAA